MAQGSYDINKASNGEDGTVAAAPAVRDVSYKSMLCALLIFLVFCLIITFVGIKFSNRGGDVKEEVVETAVKGNVGLIGREKPTTTETPSTKFVPPTRKPHLGVTPIPKTTPATTTQTSKSTTETVVVLSTTPKPSPPITTTANTSKSIEPQQPTVPTTSTAPISVLNTTTAILVAPTPILVANTTSAPHTTSIPTKPIVPITVPPTTAIPTNGTLVPVKPTAPIGTQPPTTPIPTKPPTTPVGTKPPEVPQTTTPSKPPTAPPTTSIAAKPPTTPIPTKPPTTVPAPTTLKPTTVDDWTSDNYWNDTSTETDFSPLIRKALPVCTTPACKSTGSRMLSLMDYSVDPCDDFYAFSCGGIKNEVAEEDTWRRILEQLYLINNDSPDYLQKYRIFYDSCVSHEYEFNYKDRIAAILKLVKEVGEIAFDKPEPEKYDLTQLFAKLILRQSLRIMDVDIDTDSQSTKFVTKISIPQKISVLKETGPWSPLSDDQQRCLSAQKAELHAENINLTKVHDSYLECLKNQGIYLNSIETVVRALGFLTGDEFAQTQQIQELRTTIEWGILDHLNELPSPNEQRKTILYKKYQLQKLSNLQTSYPFLDWKALLETLTGHTLEDTTPIQVYFPDYFKKLFDELQKLPKWKINNALIAMFAQDLFENLVVPQAKHNREDYCVRVAAKVFADLSSQLYMKTWPMEEVEEAQQFLTKIYNQIKAKLTEGLEKADWVDAGSKIPMLSKLKNKVSLVFNKKDDIYNDAESLGQRYNSLTLNESNFMDNAVMMLHTSKKLLFDLQGKLYNVKYLWGNFVNAWDREPISIYAKGLIVIPMGVIKIPVREELPGYLMMSQLGLSLARELGRHFDLIGIQRGITLSPSFKRVFKSFRKVMEDKTILSGTRMHLKHRITFHADPQLSANERIVDNTAVRLITDSFDSLGEASILPWVSTSYSREKIFFITLAQEYCKNIDMQQYMEDLFEREVLPPSLRVENIVSNSEAFQKVFECPDGSAMNNNPNFKLQFPYLHKPDESEEDEEEDDSDDYLSNNQL